MRWLLLLSLAGCALPEVEKVAGDPNEQTADHACPGLKLAYDQSFTQTFSIDDNPVDEGETCDDDTGLRRAIFQVELADPQIVNVIVDPVDDGTFTIEAYATCPITTDDGGMCNTSIAPGEEVSVIGPANLSYMVVWGTAGRFDITAYLTTP